MIYLISRDTQYSPNSEARDEAIFKAVALALSLQGEPIAAIYRQSTPESTLTLEPRRVAEGQSIDVRFRVTLITPYTWWQPNALPQAAKDSFTAHMRAFANTITLLAIPEIV